MASPYQPYPGTGYNRSAPPPPASLQAGYGAGQQNQYPPSYSSPSPYPSQYPQSPYQQQPYSPQPPNNSYNRPAPPPPSQHAPSGYQQPYGQQPQYGQPQPYGQPPMSPQQPYGAPQFQSAGYNYGQQPQQGGYPPQGGQQYGGAPPQQGGPAQINAYKQLLSACVQENNLHDYYPPNSPLLDQVANRAAGQVAQLCQKWRVPQEIGNDIVKLALFDIILYIDDSGSMAFEENGERIDDLKLILNRVAFAATLFDDDGISLRFMNSDLHLQNGMLDGVKSEQQIENIMRSINFSGLTPMGTKLQQKVIEGILMKNNPQGRLKKPVLIITITDGQPAGEAQDAIFQTIRNASSRFRKGLINFQFAQVGNDKQAREFLGKLDNDPVVGDLIDCTSNYENESEEMKAIGVTLTPEMWLIKLLLGAIDHSYDRKDESGRPPQGQYGGPQQGHYGGAPPPGQYGGPPQGQYPPQQQGGYPGHPPQQGGYPPQQQGYGQPPQYGQQQGYQPQQGGYPGQQQRPPQGYPPQQGYGQPGQPPYR